MLHYSSGCLCGGSCAVCKDWTEEQWKRSDAQRDKRLAKMADRGVGKKAKGSVKGTPSHKTKISPGKKTVVSPGQVVKFQLVNKIAQLIEGYIKLLWIKFSMWVILPILIRKIKEMILMLLIL